MQNRGMGQRLDRGHAYKGGKVQVDSAKLIAVSLEVGSEERVGFAIEGFHTLEPFRARYLLCKDAMKLGIDAMRLNRYGHKPAHCFLNWLRGHLSQRAADDAHDFLIVTIDDGGNERLFAGVILVKRANAHACHFS